jgi:DNA-binding Lrp family transcriptional regulator
LYLYDKTTYQKNGVGVVLGGKQITNNEIAHALNIGSRSITRYVKLLTELGFIYTINVYGNIRIWFVIGYKKYNEDSSSKKNLDSLVHRASARVLKDVKNGTIKPINPFFSEVDNSVHISGTRKTKTSTANDKSDSLLDKSVLGQDKIVLAKKDRTFDKTLDTTETRIEIDKLPINQNSTASTAESATNDDVIEVYQYFMTKTGSNKKIPSDSEVELIENILKNEDVDTLKNCIDKYVIMVDNNPSWRYYPPARFFKDDFYFGYLDPNRGYRYEPRNPVRDLSNFSDNN